MAMQGQFSQQNLMMKSRADPVIIRDARAALKSDDTGRRDAVLAELDALAGAEITDVLSWDANGEGYVRASEELPARVRKAIKRVKVRPTSNGNEIEVELHDKLAALRLLSKHTGLLDDAAAAKPTLIGINVKHAQPVEYSVDEPKADKA